MLDTLTPWARRAWNALGRALLVLIVVEVASQLVLGVLGMRPHRYHDRPDLVPARASSPPWWGQYHREYEQSHRLRWRPYTYWRRPPFHGQFINVEDDGLRRTWNPGASAVAGQPRVFVFGGSTMWGTGVRDDFTIPSLLSKALHAAGRDAWVVNYGETGYVSTQEVLILMQELQRGNVPDVVVFYDGVNDAFSAWQTGVPGQPENEFDRAMEFNLLYRWNIPIELFRQSTVLRCASWVADRVRPSRPTPWSSFAPTSTPWRTVAASRDEVAARVVDTYLGNIALVEALSRQYGFQVAWFWQPSLLQKAHRTPDEQKSYDDFDHTFGGGVDFYNAVYEAFARKKPFARSSNVRNLSRLFEDEAQTMYVDHYHCSEEGHARVVEAMAPLVRDLLVRGRPK